MATTGCADNSSAIGEYLANGAYTNKYGYKNFRVLTITLTDERELNLCRLALDVLPEVARRWFLFGSIDKISNGMFV